MNNKVKKLFLKDKYIWYERLIYVIAWLLIFCMPWIAHLNTTVGMDEVVRTWKRLVPFVLIFILNDTVLIPYLLAPKHKLVYMMVIVLIMLAVWFGSGKPYFVPPPHPDPHGPQMGMLPKPPYDMFRITNMIIASCVIFANIAIKMYFVALKKDMQVLQIRNEQILTELKSLKYQINPHFLMNTLNNIQALIDIDQEKASETIQELSKMMRYVLYEDNAQEVPLKRDLDFMLNFIRLMEIRYPDHVDISVNFPEATQGVKVPSLLFTSFVENAFKHGISYKRDSVISIDMRLSDSRIFFRCMNTKSDRPASGSQEGGIGLENVRRRLDLLYGDDYSLTITDNNNIFLVELDIPVKNDQMHSN